MKNYLIILSGWAVDKLVWSPLCKLLDKDYDIIVIDWENVTSMEGFKQKATTIIRQKSIESFSIIGWSLGALVALDIVAELAPQIERIILFSATSRFIRDDIGNYSMGWDKKIVERMLFRLEKHTEETLGSFYKNLFTEAEVNDGYYEHFLKETHVADKRYSIQSLSIGLEYLLLKDLRERIDSIDMPVLLIHGNGDIICPTKAGVYLDNHLKASKLIILDQIGHMPFFTKTKVCCEMIKNHMLRNN